MQTFIGGNAMIAAKTNGVYPAPKAIMSCVYEGLQLPFDTALKVETRYFVSLLRDPVAKSMIRTLFFGLQEANKLARRPKGVAKQEYKKIGILGAGLANGITPRDMCGMSLESDAAAAPHHEPFATFYPSAPMRPAFWAYMPGGQPPPPRLPQSRWPFTGAEPVI